MIAGGLMYFVNLGYIFTALGSLSNSTSVPAHHSQRHASHANQILNSIKEHHVELNVSSSLDASDPRCQTIHIGIVCNGHKHNMYLHTMLKSLLFYRVNPVELHVVANKHTRRVFEVLFDSWQLPQFNVSYYDVSNSVNDVRWIPNNHYSGVYGLLKILFPSFLPVHITKIIVLDTDLTFMSDIAELWAMFDLFEYNQVIGLVENESDYYLTKKNGWPTIGRGYNTGMIMYKVERLRFMDWTRMWTEITKTYATTIGPTSLGDQDIINSVLKKYPAILYTVPCNWNTQLSEKTLSKACYSINQVKIIHWNSPKKTEVANADGDYFRNLFNIYLEMNGNHLRKQLYDCSPAINKTADISVPQTVCNEFNRGASMKWRTLLYFRPCEFDVASHDVTFLAHLSYERLQMVEELSKHWEGPIILVLYLSDPELQLANQFIEKSEILEERVNIAYHVVFRDGNYYPINFLRNVGLRTIQTPYVFLADIDFLPNFGLYNKLRRNIEKLKPLVKKAIVIPAFEIQQYKSKFPRTKGELLNMLSLKMVFTFRYDVWPPAHSPTNYTKWKNALDPYTVKWLPDYEPYVVVKHDVVKYDARFMGFGWNKVSHIMELEALGYEFIVLPNAFVIHKSHAPSYDIAQFRSSPIYRMCLQNLKEQFIEMLLKKYGRNFNDTIYSRVAANAVSANEEITDAKT